MSSDMPYRYAVDPGNSAWRDIDGEIVLINSETTHYYSLNETGSIVWKLLLEHDLTAAEISAALAERCDVSAEEIEPQVSRLLDCLYTERLVTQSPIGQVPGEISLDDFVSGALQFDAPQLVKYDTLEELVISGE